MSRQTSNGAQKTGELKLARVLNQWITARCGIRKVSSRKHCLQHSVTRRQAQRHFCTRDLLAAETNPGEADTRSDLVAFVRPEKVIQGSSVSAALCAMRRGVGSPTGPTVANVVFCDRTRLSQCSQITSPSLNPAVVETMCKSLVAKILLGKVMMSRISSIVIMEMTLRSHEPLETSVS